MLTAVLKFEGFYSGVFSFLEAFWDAALYNSEIFYFRIDEGLEVSCDEVSENKIGLSGFLLTNSLRGVS